VTKTSIGATSSCSSTRYYFDILGPLRLLLFFDAGQAYAVGQGFYWNTMSTSTGVEARSRCPCSRALPAHLRLEPNRDFYQPATAFKFAVGTTF